MTNKSDNGTEDFKNATAATLRAMSEARHMGVTFSAAETPDYTTPPNRENTRLPLPPLAVDEKARAALRGASDAKALRLRHHDRNLHLKNAPMDLNAAAMFEALEQARYEALGMTQMKGVENNLGQVLS